MWVLVKLQIARVAASFSFGTSSNAIKLQYKGMVCSFRFQVYYVTLSGRDSAPLPLVATLRPCSFNCILGVSKIQGTQWIPSSRTV